MPRKVSKGIGVGDRVKHKTIKTLNEGVIVWKHSCVSSMSNIKLKDKEWSVHWVNGQRGIYRADEILIIPPKKIEQLTEIAEDSNDNEEKE